MSGTPTGERRLSRRRLLAAGGGLLATGVIGTGSALYTDEGDPDGRPLVVGHRGAAGLAPANTVASIERALEHDVDGVELDVRRTADGELILFHDPVLDWATDGHGRVHDTPWAEIRDVRFDGERIPTLRDGLAALADADVELFLEAKRVGYTDAILDVVSEYGMLDRLTLTSFEPEALPAARDRGIRTGLLGKVPNPELIEDASDLGVWSVSSHYVPRALPWFLDEAEAAGLRGGIWHLTETERIVEDGLEADPEYVTTNRPDLVLDVLDRETE